MVAIPSCLVSSIKMEWFVCLIDFKEVNVLHEPYFQILSRYVSYSRFHVSSMVMYYIIAPSAVVMDDACSKLLALRFCITC